MLVNVISYEQRSKQGVKMRLSIGQLGQIFKLCAEISDCPQVIYSYDPACSNNFLKTLVNQQLEGHHCNQNCEP